MFKVGCYITGSKGLAVLETLIEFKEVQISFVVLEKNIGVKGNCFERSKALCNKHELNILSRNQKTPSVNLKFTAGWKWILEDLDQLVVLHDSILPKLKGFAPLVTALINGDNNIGSTAFWASEDYDSGNILYQTTHNIITPIRISDATKLIEADYRKLVTAVLNDLTRNELSKGTQQDNSKSTYSMWRDQEDYHINWNQSVEEIRRFIYAVGHPFEGAFSLISGDKVRIMDCEIIPDIKIENRTIGKVFSLADNIPVIVAKDGLIKITHATDDAGKPYKFKILKTRLQ